MADDVVVVVWMSRYFSLGRVSTGGSNENPLSEHPQLVPDGGGGGGEPALTIAHSWKCPTNDSAAKKAADVIKSTPSSYSQEFSGALVQLSAGSFAISGNELFSNGLNNGTGMVRGLVADVARFQGSIHNHPRGRANADPAVDRYPSDAGWEGIDSLKVNRPEVDLSNFTIYIIDHSGDVRGFRYADKHLYPKNADIAARQSGVNLPPIINDSSGCHQ